VPAALDGERIDRVVAMITGTSRSEASELVTGARVTIDGAVVVRGANRVTAGEVIEIDVPGVSEDVVRPDASVPLEVVYEDEHLVVVDKQAGVVVHPGAGTRQATLVDGVLARYPEIGDVGQRDRPGIVHRLDKGTSGLLLVARTPVAYERLVAALRTHEVERRYRTLVWGHPGHATGMIDAPIGRSAREPTRMTVSVTGKDAQTRYEVLARFDDPVVVAELGCWLETGRTHQVRVHLSSIGHAVVGDVRYGGARQSLPCPRPWLHAEHLALAHPVTGERLSFTAPLPDDLREVRDRLS
jgi:23S rRNA pseudouridine1911/1915/1917 synthase